MNASDKCRRLAVEILSFFKEGITIDGHTRQYINSCLPGISIEEVARRICDTPDIEVAPLMDLIFFPNMAIQIRLESCIETEVYDLKDESIVTALLEAESIQTTLRDAENLENVTLRVPTSALAPFVHRLGITRRIPDRLVNAIISTHSTEVTTRLKVMLRNTRFPFSPSVTDFLVSFFKGMDPEKDVFHDCFEILLALLEKHSIVTDPFHLMKRETDALHKAREASLLFEKQLQRNNMETLMQQGIRAPEIGTAEAEKKIDLIDRIAGAVSLGDDIAKRRD